MFYALLEKSSPASYSVKFFFQISDPKSASLLLSESFKLNRCDFDTYYKYMISLKATNEISQIEWNDMHLEGELILKDFLQSGKYSQYCVNRMNSDVGKESSSMSRKMGLEDSFHFENSVTSLRWSLYISADMIGDKERAWSHLMNAHNDGNKNNHYDFHKKKLEMKRLLSTFKDGYWPPKSLGMGSNSRIPVFIVGFFRSGSTLLETMLDAHKNIWGMGEESVFIFHLFKMKIEMQKTTELINNSSYPTNSNYSEGNNGIDFTQVKQQRKKKEILDSQSKLINEIGDSSYSISDIDGSITDERMAKEVENPYSNVLNKRASLILQSMNDKLRDATEWKRDLNLQSTHKKSEDVGKQTNESDDKEESENDGNYESAFRSQFIFTFIISELD